MSAGQFIDTVYEADSGLVFPTRVQPETELATLNGVVNDASSEAVTPGAPFISVRTSKRSPKLQVRHVWVKMLENPTGQYADYQGIGTTHRLVVSNPTVFAGLSRRQPATYLGAACQITRVVGEVN